MLEIRLLGQFDVRRDGQRIEIPTRAGQSLLAFLVLHAEAPQRRAKLAGLLWPESDEVHASKYLRQALWRMRKAIGAEYVRADRVHVSFDPEAGCEVDVVRLLDAQSDTASTEALLQAAAAYGGDLLPGFFDEWVVLERERVQGVYERTLQQLLDRLLAERRWTEVLKWGERWIALGGAPEPAYRALMEAHAGLGDVAAMAAAYRRCGEVLAAELGVAPSGETRALYEQLLAGAQPVRAPRNNLPAQPTPFVGREEDLVRIQDHLSEPGCRLLTLVGPGGVGKTRLAVQVAAQWAERSLQGVCYVPLASVSAEAHLVTAIATALGLTLSGSAQPHAQLMSHLHERELLLVLDGFEQLLAAAGLLAEMLAEAPGVKLLVTSRVRLNLQVEWVFDVQGLPVPPHAQAGRLEEYSAVALFLQCARRAQAGYTLAEAEIPSVVRICRQVEGLPLGLELAATWVRSLSCREIAAQIETNLDFLTTAWPDVPERHQSLRAAFDHSWDLLSAQEQALLGQLSVFQVGFTLAAAEAVAGGSPGLLAALVDKSLLRLNASGRYDMHDLVRQYAGEKLAEWPAEQESAQRLHCEFYARFLQKWVRQRTGGRQKAALEAIGAEIDNVRMAWRWALARKNVAAIGSLLDSLVEFYDTRSWYQEAEDAMGQAAAALGQEGEWAAAPDDEQNEVLGAVLAQQGWFCLRLDRIERARALLERSLALLRSAGAGHRMDIPLNALGKAAFQQGEFAEANRLLGESLALRRAAGDRQRIASTLANMGVVARALGEYQEARRLTEESLALCREIGDLRGVAIGLNNLGQFATSLAEYSQAKQLLVESLAITKELGDQGTEVLTLGNLGDAELRAEAYAEALQYLGPAVELAQEIGFREGLVYCLKDRGMCHSRLGDHRQGEADLRRALTIAMELQALRLAREILVSVAATLQQRGAALRAVELLAHVLHQPTIERAEYDLATRLLAELKTQLSAAEVAAAMERGSARTLEDVVAELLSGGVELPASNAVDPSELLDQR